MCVGRFGVYVCVCVVVVGEPRKGGGRPMAASRPSMASLVTLSIPPRSSRGWASVPSERIVTPCFPCAAEALCERGDGLSKGPRGSLWHGVPERAKSTGRYLTCGAEFGKKTVSRHRSGLACPSEDAAGPVGILRRAGPEKRSTEGARSLARLPTPPSTPTD